MTVVVDQVEMTQPQGEAQPRQQPAEPDPAPAVQKALREMTVRAARAARLRAC